MSSMIKIAIIAAAASVAQAAPWAQAGSVYSSANATVASTLQTAYSSATTSANGGTFTIPAQVSVDPASSKAAASAAASLAVKVHSEVSQVDKFNDLLTIEVDGRRQLVPQAEVDSVVRFDFNKAANTGEGGRILTANNKNFPILTDQGIATAVGFLGPCGMNSPHTHPRATEFLTLVQGRLQTGFMLENGFLADLKSAANPAGTGAQTKQVMTELSAFQGTVFPMGSIHFQFNPTCEPATFVASLTSDDPGTSQIAQNFFFQDERIVNITLGGPQEINGQNINDFRNMLPANLVQAHDECMASCPKY